MLDVLIVGGGPAGSTCARTLTRAGARVAIIDRAEFPRVKLCAGWLSPGFWDVIERAPREYPRGLWEWHQCHVHYRGRQYSLRGHGWFIRRYELDDWLLRESGAELHLGANVKDIVREPDGTWRIGELRAKYLVGAAGTHCPVARMLAPERPRRAVGVQELELQGDAGAIARTRLGDDGEPELVLFDDLGGYGWNVPKRDWLNIGCGTLDATAVRDAWETTHALLRDTGHVPAEAEAQLGHMKGHSYFLFDPAHLAAAARDGAFLVGDSLGLAHPLTAEGIVPAATSGRLLGEAIASGNAASYAEQLAHHPLIEDYRRTYRVIEAARRLRRDHGKNGNATPRGHRTDPLVARGFARMFSGKPLPAAKLIDLALDRRARRTRPNRADAMCREALAEAGIVVGGSDPWDITVHDDRFYQRILRDGTLGFGESYMAGWWDSPNLDQTIDRVCRVHLREHIKKNRVLVARAVKARVFNLQSERRAFEVAYKHYDIGNDLYEAMLDKRMLYTCAYWDRARTLDEAQEAKLELVCQKIGLRPGMQILDLGCGWGGFAAFAAERYCARVVGYTVAAEQVKWAKDRYAHLPIDIRHADYRTATGRYDAVVSIGLMEHVGPKNYRAYMELVDRCLAPGGVGFVHTICGNRATMHIEPWFDKYIFPNAVLPFAGAVLDAMQGLFVIEDVHNIGEHYDPTLMAWWHNFDAAWPRLEAKYGATFYRMWKYYLLGCAGGFRARETQLCQFVFTRQGTKQPAGARSA